MKYLHITPQNMVFQPKVNKCDQQKMNSHKTRFHPILKRQLLAVANICTPALTFL